MNYLKQGIFAATGVLLIAVLIFSVDRITAVPISIANGKALPVIIVDPGHGGLDGGAVGVDGIIEKDINLSIALELRNMLVIGGFKVVMTREEDISIHDEGVTGVRRQKTSDLRNRLAMTTQYPNVIFISIHQNKFGNSAQSGLQVFYGPQNVASKELAGLLQYNAIEMLQPDNNREFKKGGKNLFLIYESTCPAVLIECGFLSNREEAHMLVDLEYQTKLAFVAFRSVVEYLGM